jgi:Na+/proline symporter
VVLVQLAKGSTNLVRGILLSIGLWLVMMLILSPVIGWGVFGAATADGAKEAKLYLAPGPKYPIATLVIHLVYGLVMGSLNRSWTTKPLKQPSASG